MTTYPLPLVYRPDRWFLTVAAPSGEPVTLAELKEHCRVTDTDEDDSFTRLGKVARAHIEDWTRRALVTQTRVMRLSRFPAGEEQVIELPGGNIQSVTSIQYQDADNATQTLATSVYTVETATAGWTGRVSLAYGQEWPDTIGRGLDVVITYVAGWADDGASPPDYGANVPEPLKEAIKMVVAELRLRKESAHSFEIHENPTFRQILSPWVIHRLA